MAYRTVSGSTDETKRRFLELPRRLYGKKDNVQNTGLEKELLEGRHILSRYFSVYPIVVLDEAGRAAGRCLLTFYEEDPCAYLGFFESVNDKAASGLLFAAAQREAARRGKSKLMGPLNASFWIGYRLKMNRFGTPYTAEPYNKAYYAALWEDAGFAVCDRYYSNALRVPEEADSSMKCKQRLQRIRDAGYLLRSPDRHTFAGDLREVYRVLIRAYSRFPMFRRIEEDEFCRMFMSLETVLDFDLVKLAYREDALAGFFICVPDYGNLAHQGAALRNLPKLFWNKYCRKERRYVLLYLGIDPKHPGLGAALAEAVKQELVKKRAASVAALIHEGGISGGFYKELAVGRYEYAMFSKEIEITGPETGS